MERLVVAITEVSGEEDYMYILKAEHSFDSAHFLKGYEGKCANIHGHRWRVILEIQSESLEAEGQIRGMVVDFGDFKKDLKQIVDSFDHALIIEENTIRRETLKNLLEDGFKIIDVNFRPTAENFAHHFYDLMIDRGYNVKRATVYETPTNCAVYEK